MKKKVSLSTLITLCIIVAAITFAVSMIVSEEMYNKMLYELGEREQQYAKISEVDRLVRRKSIYKDRIDEKKLNDNILAGYLRGLGDPFSYYLTAEEYQAMEESYEGAVAGIGIEGTIESGYIRIIEVYNESPAELDGLKSGDLIVEIDGMPITKDATENTLSYEKAILALKGEPGSNIEIKYRRDKIDQEVSLVRRVVTVPSVRHKVIGDNTGYIRITEFNDSTPSQFNNAINDLINTQKVNGIVFDVRNNKGGTLKSVEAILDRILKEDEVITSYTNFEGEKVTLRAKSKEFLDLPMVVIVNENTASAAELFTAAIRDYDLGKIVGATTYGKGTMQEIIKLNDGSAISLSTAVYQTPNGSNFDGIGIRPDYDVTVSSDQQEYYRLTSFADFLPDVDNRTIEALRVLNDLKRAAGIETVDESAQEIDTEAVIDTNEVDSELIDESEIETSGSETSSSDD